MGMGMWQRDQDQDLSLPPPPPQGKEIYLIRGRSDQGLDMVGNFSVLSSHVA